MKTSTKLKKMLEETTNELEKDVINYVLDDYETDEEIKMFFEDLQTSGCQGGMISHLIYYEDTHEFFNEFQDEIEDLKKETEEAMGEPLNIKGNITNWLAWFGFEETAYKIYNELY